MARDGTRCRKREFAWIGENKITAQHDLRALGWGLCTSPGVAAMFAARGGPEAAATRSDISNCPALLDLSHCPVTAREMHMLRINPRLRRHVVVLGLDDGDECAAALRSGFGDALLRDASLDEISARLERILDFDTWIPRFRDVGPLHLDLIDREAFAEDQALDLNPREFSLIWRLADDAGMVVSKQALIQDVWRMGFVPETNSIAVHMSRLRRKLGYAGLAGIIVTAPEGGYRLAVQAPSAPDTCPPRQTASCAALSAAG